MRRDRKIASLALAGLLFFCLGWRRLLIQGQLPVDGNMIALSFPNWRLMRSIWEHPRLPLWNPARDFGEPHAADPQTMALYPPMWVLSGLGGFSEFMRLWIVLHALLAAAFMSALAWRWYRSLPASFAAAAIAALNGFFTARVTFPNHFASSAWLPAVLYFQSEESAAGVAVCLALQWFAGFPPFSLLSVLAALGLAARQGRAGLRAFWRGCVGFAGLSAAGWLPFLEMLAHSTRSLFLPAGIAAQFSLPPAQLLKELLLPEWCGISPSMQGDPAIVAFYVGPVALALAARGVREGPRERRIAAAAGAAMLLSLGRYLPGYRNLVLLHVFRFPANWLLLASAGIAILAAAGVSRIRDERRRWVCAGLVALDLVVFGQFPRSGWALPAFFEEVPALARRALDAGAPGPVRIYHTSRLMNRWRGGFLENERDFMRMREFLAPSFGTAFGLQEALSYQTLLYDDAAAFQARLEYPGSDALDIAGVSMTVDIGEDAIRGGPEGFRVRRRNGAKNRIFLAGDSPSGTVQLVDYRPGRALARIDVPAPAVAVFSESDYPGWGVYLDGKKIPHGRFEGIFPSVEIPPGRHELLLCFFPLSFGLGLAVSLLTLAAPALRSVRSVFQRRR